MSDVDPGVDPDLNPQPRAWPRCAECKTSYVLRRATVFVSRGRRMKIVDQWVWQRDCKHKKAAVETAGVLRVRPRARIARRR